MESAAMYMDHAQAATMSDAAGVTMIAFHT